MLGLTPLVNTQQQMTEHRRRIVHEGGRKDQRNRCGIELFEPQLKAFAGLRRQARFVDGKCVFQPMITGDEGAARRLTGSPDEFGGKKLRNGSFELGFGIVLAVRCKKEPGFIGLALISTANRLAIVKQQVPIALFVQRRSVGARQQLLKI